MMLIFQDTDPENRARIEQERLEKNKERRKKREKQKKLQQKIRDGGVHDDGSPEPTAEKVTGTTRKCANCGQVGHIKTNKKYVCPCSQGRKAAPGAAARGDKDGPKKKSRKRDSWRPTQDPRVGDKFWDPRCWEAGAFDNKMEAPPPSQSKQRQLLLEDAENWASLGE